MRLSANRSGMDVTITPTTVGGQTQAPPSKSYTHRAILAAGYSAEATTIKDPLISADTKATMRVVDAFGGTVTKSDTGELHVTGFAADPSVPDHVIDCANSGTTIRLATAAASLAGGMTVLTGDESLRSRPQGPLLSAIEQLGGTAYSTRANGQAPLVITGPISGGHVAIPGDVSSQFITALLMAGAHTSDGITIALETELKSAPYVDITVELLADFGIQASATDHGFRVDGNQVYHCADETYRVPGDFSSISYLLAAGVLASPEGLVISGAKPSAQGDSEIIDILTRMGADLQWEQSAGRIEATRSTLTGVTVDVSNTPDLLPTLAVLGAVADGTTRLTNCEHVRYKETDRVRAMATALDQLGVTVDEQPDELIVHGGKSTLTGGTVNGRADHRVIMALVIAGLVASDPVTVRGADHVDVSFPQFFEVIDSLGGTITRT